MTHDSQSELRIGAVGCGVVATAYYFPYLLDEPRARLVAVCDLDEARAEASKRLFQAEGAYTDYHDMLERANLDAVLILTSPGTHAPFALAAAARGIHFLLQKPMALSLDDATRIVEAVRTAGVKAVIEPSVFTALENDLAHLRRLVDQGVLGDPYWFSYIDPGPESYHGLMGGNPYGNAAFYAKDSGGMLFDFPYAPSHIVTLLGDCKSVSGLAKISVPERFIVPERYYTEFLTQATDPYDTNYWDVVFDRPKSQRIPMEAEDNVFSLYEMDNGATGVFHIGRPFHPALPGTAASSGLQIFGTEGNLIFGGGYTASVISAKKELLPKIDDDGWYHIPIRGDHSKAQWPKPVPGAFNYYVESTRHMIDCILEDRDPLVNVEWGRHITEMLAGAIESSRTGLRYEMTTTTRGLRENAEMETVA